MTEKDPKDMAASELLRWAANGEADEYGCCHTHRKLFSALSGKRFAESNVDEDREHILALADEIDADLEAARMGDGNDAFMTILDRLITCNSYPSRHEGEGFVGWVKRCFILRPRYEDGEPVQFGDEIELHYRGGGVDKGRFQEIAVNRGPVCILSFTGVDHALEYRYDSELDVIKRPASEVLGADGLPVKVGETAWDMASELEIVVSRIAKDEDGNVIVCANGDICELQFAPKNITHTPPDTQKRIDDGARKDAVTYWGCGDCSCNDCNAKIDGMTPKARFGVSNCKHAQVIDLLRRQRELDARKGGTE